MKEQWRAVKGYEDRFEVSNLGRVKRLKGVSNYDVIIHEKILKPSFNEKGYLRIGLYVDEDGVKQKLIMVHRLVAAAFIPNPNNKREINHKDGDKTNNNISNLEWVTHAENMSHANNNGLAKCKKIPVIQMTLDGKIINTFKSIGKAAKGSGCDSASIKACCLGFRNTSKGFKWKFVD